MKRQPKNLMQHVGVSLITIFLVLSLSLYIAFADKKNTKEEPIVSGTITIVPTQTLIPTTDIPAVTISTTPTVTSTPTVKATSKPTAVPTKKPTSTPKVIATPSPTATSTPTPVPTFDYSKPWTVAANCPSTTLNCVPCTSGSDCRYEPGKTHGFRGWACQNNNPGNIRNASTNMATDSKNAMIARNGGTPACGVRNDSRGGSYFVFSTYSAGIGALKAYVKGINNGEHTAYTNCGNCTLSFFFSKYAPGDSSYATKVAEYMGGGVTTSTKLQDIISQNKLDLFVAAIKNREGFITQ